MAKELSQEEVLDFLCQGGGKVTNASLLGYFKRFLRDQQASTELQLKRREKFKRYINSVAVVKQEGAVKYVVLRSRYRDLLGEEMQPATPTADPDKLAAYVSTRQEEGGAVPSAGLGHNYLGAGEGSQPGELRGDKVIPGYGEQVTVEPTAPRHSTYQLREADSEEAQVSSSCLDTKCYFSGDSWVSSTSSRPNSSPPCPVGTSFTSRSPEDVPSPPWTINCLPNQSLPSNNLSLSFSSADSPGLPAKTYSNIPSQALSSHKSRKCSLGTESLTGLTNPAFVSMTCRDLQEQREGCLSCTELQAPNFHTKCDYAQTILTTQGLHNCMDREQTSNDFNLPNSSSPTSYLDPTITSSLLQIPNDTDKTPDTQLKDYQLARSHPSHSGNDMYGLWSYQIPIFRSIRCQLSLNDLEDFVDQDSCGSESSDSGEGGDCDSENNDHYVSSASHKKKHLFYSKQKREDSNRCLPDRSFHAIIGNNRLQDEGNMGMTGKLDENGDLSRVITETNKSVYTEKSFLTDQAPILFELAENPPRDRVSIRCFENISSSDEELIDRDYKRRRRPSRSKNVFNISVVPPQPDVDRVLATKSVIASASIGNCNPTVQQHTQAQYAPKKNIYVDYKKPFNQKPSVVPLDPMEHDWFVKTASGSWLQVYGMFTMDPHLALRKDFITGYTALHWFAKHGCSDMFHKFVDGAKRYGIQLDMNVKSSSGYTPLHIAAIHGHHKVAAMLVEKLKVNVKARDNSGKRAWQYLSCSTSGEVWQLLGAPRGKTIFVSRALQTQNLNTKNTSNQLNRKASLAAFRKTQHQRWKASNLPALREREIYSD